MEFYRNGIAIEVQRFRIRFGIAVIIFSKQTCLHVTSQDLPGDYLSRPHEYLFAQLLIVTKNVRASARARLTQNVRQHQRTIYQTFSRAIPLVTFVLHPSTTRATRFRPSAALPFISRSSTTIAFILLYRSSAMFVLWYCHIVANRPGTVLLGMTLVMTAWAALLARHLTFSDPSIVSAH